MGLKPQPGQFSVRKVRRRKFIIALINGPLNGTGQACLLTENELWWYS